MCMFWHEMKATVDCWIGEAAEQHVSPNPFLYKNKIKKSIYPFVVSQINVWKDKHQTIHIHHREIVKERSFQFLSLNSLLFEIFTLVCTSPRPGAAFFRGLPSVSHSPLKTPQPYFPSMSTSQVPSGHRGLAMAWVSHLRPDICAGSQLGSYGPTPGVSETW